MRIPERYVRHIWKNLYLRLNELTLCDGRSLQVLSTGTLNPNEGADFLNARLLIDGVLHTGNVEIHSRSSDWLRHQHHRNPRYDSVILHVVFEHDAPESSSAPVLELRPFLHNDLHCTLAQCIRDEAALSARYALPCSPAVLSVADDLKLNWLQQLSEARFTRKVQRFAERLTADNYDELIYQGLMRALGYSENITGFEQLAALVRFQDLQFLVSLSFSERRITLEAIFFSLSGLLPEQSSTPETQAYTDILRQTFQTTPFVHLPPLSLTDWIFFRLRPSNFPTLRLAALAEILSKNLSSGFLHKALEIAQSALPLRRKITQLEHLFIADASGYWQHHYRFGERSQVVIRTLVGKHRASEIVINTLLPVLSLYATRTHNHSLADTVSSLYASYPKGLTNRLSEKTMQELLGDSYQVKSAAFEQGLLELKQEYCNALRCLECRIGQAILGV
ncbi:MAG: DUF2851 family protein [Chloroherpetonaceae bacterium]|nr:DUF2851 family protein [Chloroherpetonaceae bacterium]MDW8466708.1 DUF2851 family protein [Chloroherpetonaceae bacterium]